MDTTEDPATPRNIASIKFPLEVLGKFADALISGETGKLPKYHHLRRKPKYQDAWGISFGNEINWLTQGKKGRVRKKKFVHHNKRGGTAK